MKKSICCAVLVVVAMVFFSPVPSDAGGSRARVGVNVGVGHGHFVHRPFVHGWHGAPRIWWGAGVWGWPYYGWGWPNYYAAPPYAVQQSPVYVQPAPAPEEPVYWYYCQNPQGYYPYVQQCPNGWMKVVPPSTPPGQ
jgi:hypothetical protein